MHWWSYESSHGRLEKDSSRLIDLKVNPFQRVIKNSMSVPHACSKQLATIILNKLVDRTLSQKKKR